LTHALILTQVLPELMQRLSFRITARLVRELYGDEQTAVEIASTRI